MTPKNSAHSHTEESKSSTTQEKDQICSEIKNIAWQAYHQCMVDNLTTGTELDQCLPDVDDPAHPHRVDFERWWVSVCKLRLESEM